MLIEFLVVLLGTLWLSAAATPIMIKLAFKTNFLDMPNGDALKIHPQPIPLLGGAGITFTALAGLLIAGWYIKELELLAWISLGLCLLFLLGLIDDRKGLSPRLRLFGQVVASSIGVLFGNLSVSFFPFAILNVLISICCIIFFINAMNFLDGMDGLAAGLSFVAGLGFVVTNALAGSHFGLLLATILTGASAGFLIYNFTPASIFLGDNGSTVLGFLLGLLALQFVTEFQSLTTATIPVLILIVPVLDLTLAVFRRLKNRIPISQGDRNHIYDRLLRGGYTQQQTAFILYTMGVLGMIGAITVVYVSI